MRLVGEWSLAVAAAAVPAATSPVSAIPAAGIFHDVTARAGITFVHDMGVSGQKMMVETMGSGGGFLDYDNDGDLDLYLVNGGPVTTGSGTGGARDALYRNDGGGRFTDVTGAAGIVRAGYGMGICAGDYDNDGFVDLYLTRYGHNVLYRNRGDGSFHDVTSGTGTGDEHWGASCAFLDHDRDGDLDLYVSNYVAFTVENRPFCGDYAAGVRAYCGPTVYPPAPDLLYRNEGDGTFTEVGEASGLTARNGNGLGVATGDYDDDGDVDLYVANDQTPNVLYRNRGNGFFDDVTLLAGVGYSIDGEPQAGMGTDFADYDNDGDLDLVVTNLDFEYNNLYRNEGGGVFSDVGFDAGIAGPSLATVGFGVTFLDVENDGLLDLAIANGHILDNASHFNDAARYAQEALLLVGAGGGTFRESGSGKGPGLRDPAVGRGLAAGDFDDDGDPDLLMTVCGGAPRLLENRVASKSAWIGLRLVGRRSNRSALGARVALAGPRGNQVREARSGGSYLSQSDPRLLFGLGVDGGMAPVSLSVRWPSGLRETFALPGTGRYVTLIEGEGV